MSNDPILRWLTYLHFCWVRVHFFLDLSTKPIFRGNFNGSGVPRSWPRTAVQMNGHSQLEDNPCRHLRQQHPKKCLVNFLYTIIIESWLITEFYLDLGTTTPTSSCRIRGVRCPFAEVAGPFRVAASSHPSEHGACQRGRGRYERRLRRGCRWREDRGNTSQNYGNLQEEFVSSEYVPPLSIRALNYNLWQWIKRNLSLAISERITINMAHFPFK